MPGMARRRRRTAEAARDEILDAAERHLVDAGPDALRLQAVAADVGVSHPAVLHHFGSREGLVEAVVERALGRLEDDLVRAIDPGARDLPDPAALLDRVSATLTRHARLLAWLSLTGRARPSERSRANWKRIVDATHALRLRLAPRASYQDTAFTVLVSALALYGEALGDALLESASVDPAARAAFRPWLAELLLRHLSE